MQGFFPFGKLRVGMTTEQKRQQIPPPFDSAQGVE